MHGEDTETIGIEALRAVTAAAAELLTAAPGRAAALTYLRRRGIDPAPLTAWPLGYAPPGWTRLVDQLRGSFTDSELIAAGVATRSSRGSLIDTFRDRVIFPIHNERGEIAGFTGRDTSGAPQAPKYLNTRKSALFNKSALLYGLWQARGTSVQASQPVVVVEGPVDVLAIAALSEVASDRAMLPVAACGTAFTRHHAESVAEIARRSTAVIAMDGDAAGRAAATTTGDRLRHAGLDVRVVVLPNGVDPAERVAQSGSLDSFRFDAALPLLAVHLERAVAAQGDRMQWVEGRLAAGRVVARHLATYAVKEAAAQIPWISDALKLAPATFTVELADAYRAAGSPARPLRRPARDVVERDCLLQPSLADETRALGAIGG